ncbi:MAG: alcohol dehydrogenase [Chloroflexi bacterium CFX7]|nr:alcohol dehydrogenase [Chloroflexi bacterium CFX7]MCK6563707.1 zinc-binding dehydrogenase [Dehalococcoidia bacterium]RIL04152.1 MAG: alcohol dehydrogenase [bacterium]
MAGTMLAARLHEPGKPLSLDQVPIPEPGHGQVLVKVHACGVCGSDVHFVEGHSPVARTPITLGHEPAGVVHQAGPGVEGAAPGQRVAVRPGTRCGECEPCSLGRDNICEQSQVLGMHVDGGLAEYVAVPAQDLIPIPEGVSFAQAAIAGDAIATPYHALIERGQLRAGETVAVFGCGGLGIHAIRLARLAGAATVVAVDVQPGALERAKRAGADLGINAAEERPSRAIRRAIGGADLAVECVGHPDSIAEAARSLKRGGRAVIVGMGDQPIALPPPNAFTWSENALIGSFGSSAGTVRRILAMAAAGRLDLSESVSAVLPLGDVNRALDMLRAPGREVVRVVIEPGR